MKNHPAGTALIEALARIEHERWAHWQSYFLDQCVSCGSDGALLIPGEMVRRWTRQIETPYDELPEEEKQSDRDQVERYLPRIEALLSSQRQESCNNKT